MRAGSWRSGLEALDAITEAGERGGDPFFIAAIRGDIYAEMERHNEAAEAYDEALDIEPEDHWALHQAALEHGYAGHPTRATALFEAALEATEEAVYNSLFRATTVSGNGATAEAIPLDRVAGVLKRYGRGR